MIRNRLYDSGNINDMMNQPSRFPQNSQFSQFDPPPPNMAPYPENINENINENMELINNLKITNDCVTAFAVIFGLSAFILICIYAFTYASSEINKKTKKISKVFLILAVISFCGLIGSLIASSVLRKKTEKSLLNMIDNSPPNVNVVTTSNVSGDRINSGTQPGMVNSVISGQQQGTNSLGMFNTNIVPPINQFSATGFGTRR